MSPKERIAALEAECARLRIENESLKALIQGKADPPAGVVVREPRSAHAAEALVRHDGKWQGTVMK